MPPNRLSRDDILLEALQIAEVPGLNQLDVSNGNPYTGTINSTAITIGWIQQAVDMFHMKFPWAGIVTSTAVTFTTGTPTIALPSDFILDLRDGLLITHSSFTRRVRRRGLQNIISYSLNRNAGRPLLYCIQGTNLLFTPTPDQGYTGTFWYYQRPAALSGATVPVFPSDLVLIEFVRIRCLEWTRALPPGAALQYSELQIRELRKSGLGHEPESDEIPLDGNVFLPGAGGSQTSPWSWLGEVGT